MRGDREVMRETEIESDRGRQTEAMEGLAGTTVMKNDYLEARKHRNGDRGRERQEVVNTRGSEEEGNAKRTRTGFKGQRENSLAEPTGALPTPGHSSPTYPS